MQEGPDESTESAAASSPAAQDADTVETAIRIELTERRPSDEALADPRIRPDWPPERIERASSLLFEGEPIEREALPDAIEARCRRLTRMTSGGASFSAGQLHIEFDVTRSWEEVLDLVDLAGQPGILIRQVQVSRTHRGRSFGSAVPVTLELTELMPEARFLEEPAIAAGWPRERQQRANRLYLDGKKMSGDVYLRVHLDRRKKDADEEFLDARVELAANRPWSDLRPLLTLLAEPEVNTRNLEIMVAPEYRRTVVKDPVEVPKGERPKGEATRPRLPARSPAGRYAQRGLDWLRNHQSEAGSWDCDGFSAECKSSTCTGKGDRVNDVGVTGLALLAFLEAGRPEVDARSRGVVEKGLHYLRSQQDAGTGLFGPTSGHFRHYRHAIATLAMVEGYRMLGDEAARRSAEKGVEYILSARNAYKAWRYFPADGDNDVSITGWMLTALFAAREARLSMDDEVMTGAIKDGMAYVEEMTDPVTGRTGYHEPGSFPAREPDDTEHWPVERSESMTAVALALRLHGQGMSKNAASIRTSVDLLSARSAEWDEAAGSIDFLYWYYGTKAMRAIGGTEWKDWRNAVHSSLVKSQCQDDDERGSWDPDVDPWGNKGGRVYATAVNTLTLAWCDR